MHDELNGEEKLPSTASNLFIINFNEKPVLRFLFLLPDDAMGLDEGNRCKMHAVRLKEKTMKQITY